MDAEEVERQLEASGRESAVEEASTTAEETAEEQGRTNSTGMHASIERSSLKMLTSSRRQHRSPG